ncbi:MAG: AIPR family protein [Trichocoleus desertorum ATA4-8-CV12]|nr:AIPR family protein [Trichocoleus desertorum ATA4-8-CV12]
MPSYQDFSLIHTKVKKYAADFGFQESSNGFYHLVFDLILGLQDDEVEDSITDSNYLKKSGKNSGHDREIDAVYIEELENDENPRVHLFNCKYTDNDKKIASTHYPSGEIDKILSFLEDLMNKGEAFNTTVNPILYSKVEEIWNLFGSYPSFVIHLCANFGNGLPENERKRFERGISKYSNVEIECHLIDDLVKLITKGKKRRVNVKLKAVDDNFFGKTDGDLSALIANVEARELIRIVLDDESIRNKVDLDEEGYEDLKKYSILEDIFEDNVRIYQKKSQINKSIKKTALSDENYRFFYFSNRITITCDKVKYQNRRATTIEIENIQIVNGSQTIHALYEAFLEDSSKLTNIQLLCRIYETKEPSLSSSIAEYTNSQNPVKNRDVRSIDFVQQKIEQEFLAMDYYYERKHNQHFGKPKHKRIDAEKAGQFLMAFYNKMPLEAKDRKKFIFTEKYYEEIFNDDINADKILLPYKLCEKIELEKKVVRRNLSFQPEKSFVLHSSYYILYILHELSRQRSIEFRFENLQKIQGFYDEALEILRKAMNLERSFSRQNNFSEVAFLKTRNAKTRIDEILVQTT